MNILKLMVLFSLLSPINVFSKSYTTKVDFSGTTFTFKTRKPLRVKISGSTMEIEGLDVSVQIKKTEIKKLLGSYLSKQRKKIKSEIKDRGDRYLLDSNYVKTRIGASWLNAFQILYFFKTSSVRGRIIDHHYYFQCSNKKSVYLLEYQFTKKERFDYRIRFDLTYLIDHFYCR